MALRMFERRVDWALNRQLVASGVTEDCRTIEVYELATGGGEVRVQDRCWPFRSLSVAFTFAAQLAKE